jgi:hypothetical protein
MYSASMAFLLFFSSTYTYESSCAVEIGVVAEDFRTDKVEKGGEFLCDRVISNRPSVMNERTICDRIESRSLTVGFVDHKQLERELLICHTVSGGRISSEVFARRSS